MGDAGQSELVRQIRNLREELNWYYTHRVGTTAPREWKRLEELLARGALFQLDAVG